MNFEVELKPKCAVIKCWENLSKESGDELIRILTDLAEKISNSDMPAIVLDLLSQAKIDIGFLRKSVNVTKIMKQNKKQIYVVNATAAADKTIRMQGMDQVLKIMPNLDSVMTILAQSHPTKQTGIPRFDVNFINPFIEGILKIFSVQCAITPKVGKPKLKGKAPSLNADIAGVIAFKSVLFSGVVGICFTEKVFLHVLERMFHEKYKTIPDKLQDAAAELINMIFGHAKQVLNSNGYTIEIVPLSQSQSGLPQIVKGLDILKYLDSKYNIVLPFETDGGTFFLDIGLKSIEELGKDSAGLLNLV